MRKIFSIALFFAPALTAAQPDARRDIEVNFHLGLAIDTFAADEHQHYLNPDQAGGQRERTTGGLDFSYRLQGRSETRVQLWIYGRTIHGARSVDIDCASNANADFFWCQQGRVNYKTFVGKDPAADLLLIMRNASSLEGFTGLRFEFLKLNQQGSDPANLYVKAQPGFLKVSGAPGGAMGLHHLAVGAIATNGFFQGSYIEGGWGRSDLFTTARRNRKKVDAFLTWRLAGPLRAFMRVTVDTDVGPGADSIQSYLGVEFDLSRLSGKPGGSASVAADR